MAVVDTQNIGVADIANTSINASATVTQGVSDSMGTTEASQLTPATGISIAQTVYIGMNTITPLTPIGYVTSG